MRRMKEKVQTKLISMSSILLDDILVPNEEKQHGYEHVSASFYDKYGNKFTFDLSLTVTPRVQDSDSNIDAPVTIPDQLDNILNKMDNIENGVEQLKQAHNIQ